MQTSYPAAFLRKRKMFTVFPLLVFPFLTMAFWALGGGQGSMMKSSSGNLHGLNLQLPDARLKDEKTLNKLSYYEKADYDSVKREEQQRNDPFFKLKPIRSKESSQLPGDSSAEKIYDRIAALDREINRKNEMKDFSVPATKGLNNSLHKKNEGVDEIEKLDGMLRNIQQSNSTTDPQMEQLSGMLDKIMDIQHPERVNEQLRESSLLQKEKIFPVYKEVSHSSISLLVDEKQTNSRLDTINESAFYSILREHAVNSPNAIEAVIHETRTIVDGAIVKLRLLGNVYVDGKLFPAGCFLYGKASLSGERLNIVIPSLRYKNSILPVSLSAYDMDGLEGIFVPGSITRDASRESSDRVVQSLALNSLNPSVGAQAAGAGIEAAKNLLSKKIKRIRVTVKEGYRILLKDKK